MNRINRYLSGALAALLTAAAPAICGDLLLDNFTDPAVSVGNWINVAADNMTTAVNGGSCTIDNSASRYVGEYLHDFGANKPATFTLSYILKSVQGSNIAGALFCRQPGNTPLGYILTTENDFVVVYKLTLTANSINAVPIFHERSFDVKPADNKLTVSKNGSTFHVSANDVFAGSFTDASYSSGDLSLTLFDSTKAVFGAVHVTDTFTPSQPRTEFSDNFNGNNLKYWRQDITSVSGPAPIINEADGKLRMTAGAGSAAYIYIDINLTAFTAKVEVSHVSGRSDSPYGFFLVGDNASQMVKFFIVGGRYYGVWKSGDAQQSLTSNPKIHGSEQASGMALTDTLEIKKRDNSPDYEFLVNGEPLYFNLGAVNFGIKGIGLLCENDMTAAFDNFYVKQNYPVSTLRDDKKQISRATSSLTIRNHAFYDMRGRKRYTTASTTGRTPIKAAGIYVNKNGRDVVTGKGKTVSDAK